MMEQVLENGMVVKPADEAGKLGENDDVVAAARAFFDAYDAGWSK